MNAPRRLVELQAHKLIQRRRELLARSSELRTQMAFECRDDWRLLSEPLDRTVALGERLRRLWQGARQFVRSRSWVLLAAPVAWRLLRSIRRRKAAPPAPRAAAVQAGVSGAAAKPAGALHWARRVSAWWSAWQVLRPVVQGWLADFRSGDAPAGRARPNAATGGRR